MDFLINRENNSEKKIQGKIYLWKSDSFILENFFFVLHHVNSVVSGKTSAVHNL